jgi:hypothetical protein
MAKPLKVSKTLAKALYNHRVDPIKYPAAHIIKKFELKQTNTFYRRFYQAIMQNA